MTSAELRSELIGRLAGAGVTNAEREAEWIIEAATGRSRGESALADELTDEQVEAASALGDRRVAGEPLQYVTGVAGFRNLELAVGPGVFIPRPETELVAQRAMELLPLQGVLIEVGTGSGAVALAVAQERDDARVLATETSVEALDWAIRNRDRLGLSVEMIHGDVLGGVPEELKGQVDVVVSNPPYIPPNFNLPPEVANYEPPVALYAGDDGLAIIRELAQTARTWLKDGGWLVLEIGEVQRDAVRGLLGDYGYRDIDVRLDMTQRPRIAEARRG